MTFSAVANILQLEIPQLRNKSKQRGEFMQNLLAEMRRYGIRNKDLSQVLALTDRTISNKLSGETEFTIKEALAIRDAFFPGLKISYLFAGSIENRPA